MLWIFATLSANVVEIYLANVRTNRKGKRAQINYLEFSDNSSCTFGNDDIPLFRSPYRLNAYRPANSTTAIGASVGVAVAVEEAVGLVILVVSSCLRDA